MNWLYRLPTVTNSATDRQYIQDEFDQLIEEIDRVAETTKFNETYLLKEAMMPSRPRICISPIIL